MNNERPMIFKHHKHRNGEWHSNNGLRTSYHPYFWIKSCPEEFTEEEIIRFDDVMGLNVDQPGDGK